jgi:hemoglobin-like flavoprotein
MTNEMSGPAILVQQSWMQVTPQASEAATLFFQNLFALDPSLRHHFSGDMREQGTRMMALMNVIIGKLDQPDDLANLMAQLGRQRQTANGADGFAAIPATLIGEALRQTLMQVLGRDFTAALRDAWSRLFQYVVDLMQAGDRAALEVAS